MTEQEKSDQIHMLLGGEVFVTVETDPFNPKDSSPDFIWIRHTFRGPLRKTTENEMDRFYVTPDNGPSIIDFPLSKVTSVTQRNHNIYVKI